MKYKFALSCIIFVWISTTITAAIVLSQIQNLSIPIPIILNIFALILPTTSVASLQAIRVLVKKIWNNGEKRLNISILGLLLVQVICEIVIATLSLTYVASDSRTICGLDERWQELFTSKNQQAIIAIQNRFNCCGLKSVKDRAWPFSANTPSSCSNRFQRSDSCLVPWKSAEKINASLIFISIATIFLSKFLAILYVLMKNTKLNRQLIAFTDEEPSVDPQDKFARLLIKDNNVREVFRDDGSDNILPIDQNQNNTSTSPKIIHPQETENQWITESSNI